MSLGGSEYDPTDPVGRLLFNVQSMAAEFESGLIRMRTREVSVLQRRHLLSLHRKGQHSQAELAELFGAARSTVYRTIQRELAKRTG